MERLCHVTVLPASGRLTADPFLHCCTDAQLPFVLERHFAGRTGLVVLRFGPDAVEGHIEWEGSEPGMDPFPHLYGSLIVERCDTVPL